MCDHHTHTHLPLATETMERPGFSQKLGTQGITQNSHQWIK